LRVADWLRVEPFGDAAVLITFGDTIDPMVSRRLQVIARNLAAIPQDRRDFVWSQPIPGYASLLIPFDPCGIAADDAAHHFEELIDELDIDSVPEGRSRVVEITVRYGGEDGPDLAEVAERTGLTPDQVVEAHAAVDYTCYFLGFAPGFGYLGVLAPELELPRRAEPRTRVPAGSVAIVGRQTAVYPSATPGGWHLIGRTEAVLWDVQREPASLLAPGDRVRFVPDGG